MFYFASFSLLVTKHRSRTVFDIIVKLRKHNKEKILWQFLRNHLRFTLKLLPAATWFFGRQNQQYYGILQNNDIKFS